MGDETPKSSECRFLFHFSRVTPKVLYTHNYRQPHPSLKPIWCLSPLPQPHILFFTSIFPAAFLFHGGVHNFLPSSFLPSFLPFPCSSHSFTVQQQTKVDGHTSPWALLLPGQAHQWLSLHWPNTESESEWERVVIVEGRELGYRGCIYKRKSASRKGYVRWFKDTVVMEWWWTFTGDCSLKDKDQQGPNS